MALSAGSRVGPYEITALLGEGGMGQVWRAHHAALKRDDALKVLPATLASDADRLARFQREAQILASLDHPNIARVYGLEGGDLPVLVMELVEGPTLADLIAVGPMPVGDALAVAQQIAEALEAAHDHGIVHRDLKPANIKVRQDGTVKVLDFGLAKALEPAGGTSPGVTQSPTITSPAVTATGVILGTAAYMSPEQARGKAVDGRADVWAFGCVLFETLTGRRLFPGDTVADVISVILGRDPDWRLLPRDTPPAVRRLLRRCLEKDPARRLRNMGDACLELADPASAADRTGDDPIHTGAARLTVWRAFGAGLVLSAILASVGAWWWTSRATPPAAEVRRLTLALSPPPTLWSLAISRDGSRVAYSGRDPDTGRVLLYVRALAELQSRPLPGTENATQPFFSPDGTWVGFISPSAPVGDYARRGQLKKVALSGGSPVVLAEAVALGASWGPDDGIVFAAEAESGIGLYRVAAAGGSPERLTTPRVDRGEQRHGWPEHVPGGDAILFSITGEPTFDGARIALLSSASTESRTIVEQGYHPRLLASGHLAYVQNNNLMVAPLDVASLARAGSPVRTVEGVRSNAVSGSAVFGVSTTGLLVYETEAPDTHESTLTWVTREGLATPVALEPDTYVYPRLSPEGRSLAVGLDREPRDIWLVDLERLSRVPLTSGDRGTGAPPPILDWAPDGSLTINRRLHTPETTLEALDPREDNRSRVLLSRPSLISGASWSPDGAVMTFFQFQESTLRDLWVMDVGTSQVRAILQTPANERAPRFSRDGRWIAYVADPAGRDEVYVRPYPGPGSAIPVSTGGGAEPVWSRDGDELFYWEGNRLMAVTVKVQPALSLGRPIMLFESSYRRDALLGVPNYDVASDGRFIMIADRPSGASSPASGLTVVENWDQELKRLVPVD